MTPDIDTKLAAIQARVEPDYAKIARELHCDTPAVLLDHPSDYFAGELRKDLSRVESILRKHFARAPADLRFCLQTIAELRAKETD